jgi:hypothetical protein
MRKIKRYSSGIFIFLLFGFLTAEGKEGTSQSRIQKVSSPIFRDRDFLGLKLPMLGNKWPNRKGSVWLSFNTSRKYLIYPDFGRQKGIPPLQFSIDYSFDHHWSLGAYYGFFNSTYVDTYGNEPYESRIRSFSGGVRLSFHFADIFNNAFGEVVNVRKWDFYSTAFLGWYSFHWDVEEKYLAQQDFSEGSFGSMGIIVGAKWIPHPKIGIFIEAGKGPVGLVNFGISGKIMK